MLFAALAFVALVAIALAYLAGRLHVPSNSASYQPLTFEAGYAGPARFTRDGNTIAYSAAWNSEAKQLYLQHSNSGQATSLNLDADVMGIADNGDMAVILKRHFLATWLQRGTLARMPLDGGAPRPILEDVYDADITRDGKDFAVVRRDGGKQRLEFPIGTVLFETSGWISDVRISPDGTQVAFIDHPTLPDDRGGVALTDRKGNVRRLTSYFATGRSLCWKPDGKEIWYTASLHGDDSGMYAVTPAGKNRTVMSAPTELVIEDISTSGQVLLESVRYQIEMGIKRSSDSRARDVESSVDVGSMSPDGQWVVYNRYQGTDYQAYVRKSDGGGAVKLGEGYGAGITWDGGTVAAARNSEPHKLYLYPTGPGEQRVIDLGDLTAAYGTFENDVTFSRDGRWAVFSAYNPQHEVRDYLLDMRDGKMRPITPPGYRAGKLSSDAARVVTLNIAAQKFQVVDTSSGKISDIPGLEKQDEVIGWDPDSRRVIAWNQELPARVWLLDIATGKRELVQTVEPLAMLGSMYARMVTSADGKTAAYRHRRGLYAIYLADGLR